MGKLHHIPFGEGGFFGRQLPQNNARLPYNPLLVLCKDLLILCYDAGGNAVLFKLVGLPAFVIGWDQLDPSIGIGTMVNAVRNPGQLLMLVDHFRKDAARFPKLVLAGQVSGNAFLPGDFPTPNRAGGYGNVGVRIAFVLMDGIGCQQPQRYKPRCNNLADQLNLLIPGQFFGEGKFVSLPHTGAHQVAFQGCRILETHPRIVVFKVLQLVPE